jgi:hypothetical protein
MKNTFFVSFLGVKVLEVDGIAKNPNTFTRKQSSCGRPLEDARTSQFIVTLKRILSREQAEKR